MNQARYHLVLRGSLKPDANRDQVIAAIAQLFNIDPLRVASLLAGKPKVIKRDLDTATAQKWVKAISQLGAEVGVVAAEVAAATPADQAAAVPEAPTAAVPVEAQKNSVPHSNFAPAFSLRPQTGDILDANEKPVPVAAAVAVPTWAVAEAGADLLAACERAAPAPSRAAPEWGLAAPGELLAPPKSVAAVAVPDLSHLDLQQN